MTRNEVLEEFRSDACDCECEAWACIVDKAMADEIVRLRDELNHARALLIDLKRYRDEAEGARPIVAAAQAYLDSGGGYPSWLALRQLLPISPTSRYATPT